MEIKSSLNNLRISPRKTREVIDLIRNKSVIEARSILEFTVKRAAKPVLKLLNSAVDSAEKNFQKSQDNLYVLKVMADEGPTLKRFFPMSRGRAYPIMKRTSHVTIVLSEMENSKIKMKNDNVKLKNKKRSKSAT